jgi:predicted Rossmann fold nucleotide-binding protein DprA/Smf involved in DNA uptake
VGVVQAGVPSGTLNAARWARVLGRPVWAVCAPPWIPGFVGCAAVVELGAKPLVSIEGWLRAVGLAKGRGRRRKTGGLQPELAALGASGARRGAGAPADRKLAAEELALVSILSPARAHHIDEIATMSRLSIHAVATVLLTLALENVVVEGPEGFYRLTKSPSSD